jgi:sulfoxide reductase catalytic subunit YedY
MLIKSPRDGVNPPLSSEITPREVYEERRKFIARMALGAVAGSALWEMANREAFAQAPTGQKLAARANPGLSTTEPRTAFKDATSYNNYYEFGLDKGDPAENAHTLKPRKHVEPNGNAKYVEFTTLADPKQMPGLRSGVLDWPYVEGLRLDEAMHPLALLTVGMYGQVLPNQNGAPVRVVLPWKYGFKSAKSIVRIRFLRDQPKTAWNDSAPSEYGFYSNVNPKVDHPRWSQATERRIGEDGFFKKKRETLMFNGYPEVASLYAGMDLKKFF